MSIVLCAVQLHVTLFQANAKGSHKPPPQRDGAAFGRPASFVALFVLASTQYLPRVSLRQIPDVPSFSKAVQWFFMVVFGFLWFSWVFL